jgi:hypothetical protein
MHFFENTKILLDVKTKREKTRENPSLDFKSKFYLFCNFSQRTLPVSREKLKL